MKDFLDPAIKGTTGILKAIKANAPTVKRVVITSSFAAIVNAKKHPESYSEKNWNPVTWEEALNASNTYRASKVCEEPYASDLLELISDPFVQTFAEKAAWDFVEKEKPNFDIATINPPFVFGPVVHYLNSLDAINTSNQKVSNLIQGKWKDAIPPSGTFLWVDVRDVALAHVRAIEVPEAGGQRFFVTAGYYSNKEIADIVRETLPELEDKFPPKGSSSDLPADIYSYDNKRSVEVLGIQYRTLKQSIADTAKSLSSIGV